MSLVDFILNLAGLLLWISWRSVPFDPYTKRTPATLAGTLRRAEPSRMRPWHFLIALAAMLVARALIYWWVGAALSWPPSVKLGTISIAFRSDVLGRMMLFSFASFADVLFVFFLWLLLLSLLSPRHLENDACQRFVRIQLGFIHSLPWPVKALLPFLIAFAIWMLPGYLLGLWGIVPPAHSWGHRAEQAAILGLSTYLVWKYTIATLLALNLLNTYVYFGGHPIWNYINAVSRRLLAPLRWLPLRLGKMDFAPLVGIVLTFAIAELVQNGIHTQLPEGKAQILVPGLVDIFQKISS